MKTNWGSGGIAPCSLNFWHLMVVSSQLHAPAALPLGRETLSAIG